MYQHTRFATAWACSHYYAMRVVIVYDVFLSFRKVVKQFFKFCWSDVAVYLIYTLALEVGRHEQAVVHIEVVVHIL